MAKSPWLIMKEAGMITLKQSTRSAVTRYKPLNPMAQGGDSVITVGFSVHAEPAQ